MNARPPLIYVAGPYRASSRFVGPSRKLAVEANILNAGCYGAIVARAGGVPLVPHAIGSLVDRADGPLADDFWLGATMEMLRRCDALLLIPGWRDSSGSCAELADAVARKVPVLDMDFVTRRHDIVIAEWIRTLEAAP